MIKKTSNPKDQKKSLTHLGSKTTKYPTTYSPEVLETFLNKNSGSIQWVSFLGTEFTSLCPLTQQPDFARIIINYIPDRLMVESKALKLYLFSFRNHGDFHEDCIEKICKDLHELMKPKFIEVIGEFTPRGGIAIYPYSSKHNKEKLFEQIYLERIKNYRPGIYSMDFSRIY
jgi:7-cyano-7-deazaguanine reductase